MTAGKGPIPPREKPKSTAQLIAELNAELRSRDPYEILRRQIRIATLDEVEMRVKAGAPAVPQAAFGPHIVRILAEMRAGR